MNVTSGNFKKEALKVLSSLLYQRIDKEFQNRRNQIILENSRLSGNTQHCMWYKGELIGAQNYHFRAIPRPANSIHPSIVEKYEALLKEEEQLEREEKALVIGYIRKVLNLPYSFDSLFRFFPEQMHKTLTGLRSRCPYLHLKPMEESEQEKFISENEEYIQLMRVRMLKNLLNA